MILVFASIFAIFLFSLIIIFLVSNCSFCHKHQKSHDEIISPYDPNNNNIEATTYMSGNMNYQNPEPAHPSQIPNDQDFAEFPSITSQIEAVSINSSSINNNGSKEKLQTSVLVYPPNQ